MANTIGVLSIDLIGRVDGFETSMRRAQVSAQRAAGTIDKQLSVSIRNTSAELTRLAGIAGVGFGAAQVIKYADSFTELQNRLRLVTKSQEELKGSTEGVYRIAQTTSQSMDSVGQVYQRIAQNADALGLSLQDVEGLTEKVAKAVAISGASAAAAEAGLTQFGQALASGVLRGDEFNSVMEQLPGLADAIAKGLNVTKAELRAMAKDGKLSAEAVVDALEKASDFIESSFNTRVKTVSQSLVELENAVGKFFGELNEGVGTTQLLVPLISALANNLDAVAVAATTYTGVKLVQALVSATAAAKAAATDKLTLATADLREARAAVAEAEANVRLAAAYGGSTAAATELAIAKARLTSVTNAVATAERNMAVATGMAGRAFAMLGGAPMAIAVGIGLAVAAWEAFGKASIAAKDDTVESIAAMNLSLDDLIVKFKELTKAQQDMLVDKYQDKIIEGNEKISESFLKLIASIPADFSDGMISSYSSETEAAIASLRQLTENEKLSADERYEAGKKVIQGLQDQGKVSEDVAESLRKQWASVSSGVDSVNDYESAIGRMKGVAEEAKSSMDSLTASAKGAAGVSGKEWDSFFNQLDRAQSTLGMTADEMARFQAAALGASEVQIALAGNIAGVNSAYDTLVKAITDGDGKAIKGSKDRIAQLIAEQAQLRANAAYAATYAAALAATGNAIDAMRAGSAESSKVFQEEMKKGQELVKQVLANADRAAQAAIAAKKVRSSGGGSKKTGKSDEEKAYEREQKQFKDWIKSQKEKIALLGTETELDKLNAEIKLGNWSKVSDAQKEEMRQIAALLDLEEKRFDLLERSKELSGFNTFKDNARDMEALTDAFGRGVLSADSYNRQLMRLGESDSIQKLKNGFGDASDMLNVSVGRMLDDFSTLKLGAAEAFGELGSDALDGFSESIGRAIVYSEDFGEAISDLGKSLAADLISNLVKLGVQYLLFKALGESMGDDATKKSIMQAGKTAAAWAPAAAAVSLASFGSNGLPATAAVIGTNLVSMGFAKIGFAEGGFTGQGNKYDPAGIVHAGEYVFNAQRVREIGLDNLIRLDRMSGYADGGYVGNSAVSGSVASLSSGASTGEITVNTYTTNALDVRQRQDGSGNRIIEIRETLKAVAADIGNPNSAISRALSRNTHTKRRF